MSRIYTSLVIVLAVSVCGISWGQENQPNVPNESVLGISNSAASSCCDSAAVCDQPVGRGFQFLKRGCIAGACCDLACGAACDAGCGGACGGGCDSCIGGCDAACTGCQQCCGGGGGFGCCCCRTLSFFGGWTNLNDYVGEIPIGNNVQGTFNEGWLLGGAIGLHCNDRWRLEQEFTYRNHTGNFWQVNSIPWDGRMNNYGTATNLYRDFGTGRFRPYVGGGAGIAYQKGELDAFGILYDINNWAFAYQVMLGMNFQTSRNSDLYMEYRYYANTSTNVRVFGNIADDFDYETGNVIFGIRFKR